MPAKMVDAISRHMQHLRDQQAATPNTVILGGGDTMNTGTPAWSDKYQCAEWPLFNGLQDAMALGNHEQDYGWAAFEQPIVFWVPSIAASGIAFYTGDRLPAWKGNVFVGGMRTGEVPRTGHLERIVFNRRGEEMRREELLNELKKRVREVRQGPDELLYVLAEDEVMGDGGEGAVLRLEPAS